MLVWAAHSAGTPFPEAAWLVIMAFIIAMADLRANDRPREQDS